MVSLLKLVLVVIVLVGLGAFLLGRWSSNGKVLPDSPVGVRGRLIRAKPVTWAPRLARPRRMRRIRRRTRSRRASVTAKIKSKMALDDLVKARNIDVDTNGTVVTLTGVVGSEAERQRAVQLAKETEGVTSVIDHLQTR